MHYLMWVPKFLVILSFFHVFTQSQSTIKQGRCSDTDRVALLGFKAKIVKDTTGALSSWIGKDCCGGGWEGVECDASTGRVIRLILQRPSSDKYAGIYMKGSLSPTLGSLGFLEILIISGMSHIGGTIPQTLSNLTHLTQLILDDNALQGNIPSNLAHLPKLQTLSLGGNHLSGQIPPALGNLRNLLQLNLAKNSLTGPVPTTFKNLLSLQALDLGHNLLSGFIPDFIGQLHDLTYIDLSSNQLSGGIPDSFYSLIRLSDLSLDHNRLTGKISPRIGNLKSLTTLSLSFNQLTGQIPESLSQLQNLWNVSLSGNALTGPLPNGFAKGLPSLLAIYLSHNKFNLGTVPEWIRNRQLSDVHLAGCGLRGSLPNFTSPDSLNSIDLSDNYFTHGLSSFLTKMSSLQKLKLSNNHLNSDISQMKLPDTLSLLDLHSNKLYGSLTRIFSNTTSKFLEVIDLSNNQISGAIPNSVSNMVSLERLDISRNRITGTIPTSIGSLLKLQWLDLSINSITGKIPENLLGVQLKHANFRANRLCGEIPQGRPYNIFPAAAYAHNLCLCGKPLPPCRGKN